MTEAENQILYRCCEQIELAIEHRNTNNHIFSHKDMMADIRSQVRDAILKVAKQYGEKK